jgi:hypothetical protein
LPCSLLPPSHPHARPTSACRRPASGPPTTCLGCPADLSGRARKGGPARSGGPPFLESPGAQRNLCRRRGGGPMISKHQHQEINTQSVNIDPLGVGACRSVGSVARSPLKEEIGALS